MKTPEEWKALEQERDELKALRNEMSKRIHLLSMRIAQHKNHVKNNAPNKINTIAYKMFGKQLKDLTPDECRQYYSARQRAKRERRKQNENHSRN